LRTLRNLTVRFLVPLLLLAGAAANAAPDPDPDDVLRPVAGGRLLWDLSDDLELIGDLWTRLPLWRANEAGGVYLRLDLRTNIEGASDFTFDVRDLQYALDVGWRARFSRGRRNRYGALVGQRGVEAVDEDGQPRVRYFGVAFEHGDLLDPLDPRTSERRLDWSLAAGPVFEKREVDGDFVLRAGARWWLLRRPGRPVLSLDGKLDGLVDGSRLDTDVSGGPTLSFFLPGGTVAAFSLHYQRSRHPLGIGHSAWLAGFHYSGGDGTPSPAAPSVHGLLAAGGGEDSRAAGRLRVRFVSPPFAHRYQGAISVDANVLTSDEPGELYYLYDVGLERRHDTFTLGAYFYHRSNHVLAEPGDGVTSINVLEAGVESMEWLRPGRRTPAAGWGRLDYRARVGYLLDSDFGEEHRWHARGGVRWRAPIDGPWQPYVALEAEAGDVERSSFTIGASPSRALDLRLELVEDDQWFAEDDRVALLGASYGF
jgi:hypothetical protein